MNKPQLQLTIIIEDFPCFNDLAQPLSFSNNPIVLNNSHRNNPSWGARALTSILSQATPLGSLLSQLGTEYPRQWRGSCRLALGPPVLA